MCIKYKKENKFWRILTTEWVKRRKQSVTKRQSYSSKHDTFEITLITHTYTNTTSTPFTHQIIEKMEFPSVQGYNKGQDQSPFFKINWLIQFIITFERLTTQVKHQRKKLHNESCTPNVNVNLYPVKYFNFVSWNISKYSINFINLLSLNSRYTTRFNTVRPMTN